MSKRLTLHSSSTEIFSVSIPLSTSTSIYSFLPCQEYEMKEKTEFISPVLLDFSVVILRAGSASTGTIEPGTPRLSLSTPSRTCQWPFIRFLIGTGHSLDLPSSHISLEHPCA